ncbi:MAG: 4-oxalomesaconate tautomerase [Hyphomicrobiales bacterium]|nr:MAG: 4-oxalomesaconate tautomerase [Hyphomicrobiales bacterium]
MSKMLSTRCMWMRGGTSKGGYFLAEDLPSDIAERDAFLLAIMGSPDARQINGMGGADPLTSKVAMVQKSNRDGVDVDYLFLQVMVDKAIVTDAQNCGNILAGVGPFAIERGLVNAQNGHVNVTIYMQNTGQIAIEKVAVNNGKVEYQGQAQIDGVPGFASAIPVTFKDTAGSSCGALLPTGNEVDTIDGVQVTLIDNGMPVVVMRAQDMGITGNENRETLEHNNELRTKLESIRLQAGRLMNLGDVSDKTVPKMSMLSKASNGGSISTRTFIPHRCHASIGVLGAVSVATACLLRGSPAYQLANIPKGDSKTMSIEHPIGAMGVVLDVDPQGQVENAAIIRTARKLFDGEIFI